MRDCGDCIACCIFVKSSPEAGTVDVLPCQYVAREPGSLFTGQHDCANCTIHKDRPDCCREYECDYIKGIWEERPNVERERWFKGGMQGKMPPFMSRIVEFDDD